MQADQQRGDECLTGTILMVKASFENELQVSRLFQGRYAAVVSFWLE